MGKGIAADDGVPFAKFRRRGIEGKLLLVYIYEKLFNDYRI